MTEPSSAPKPPSRRQRYYQYLTTSDWQRKRAKAFEAYGRRCNRCKNHRGEMHVHHKRYRKDWEKAEVGDLEILCRKCHQKHHREQKRMRRINRKPRYSSGPNLPKPSAAVAELFGISK